MRAKGRAIGQSLAAGRSGGRAGLRVDGDVRFRAVNGAGVFLRAARVGLARRDAVEGQREGEERQAADRDRLEQGQKVELSGEGDERDRARRGMRHPQHGHQHQRDAEGDRRRPEHAGKELRRQERRGADDQVAAEQVRRLRERARRAAEQQERAGAEGRDQQRQPGAVEQEPEREDREEGADARLDVVAKPDHGLVPGEEPREERLRLLHHEGSFARLPRGLKGSGRAAQRSQALWKPPLLAEDGR